MVRLQETIRYIAVSVQYSRMYNIESHMYSTYAFFCLQFHNCRILFEYKRPLLKECRILCHLRLYENHPNQSF